MVKDFALFKIIQIQRVNLKINYCFKINFKKSINRVCLLLMFVIEKHFLEINFFVIINDYDTDMILISYFA